MTTPQAKPWAWARDVPRSCECGWDWSPAQARYTRARPNPACPWHTRPPKGGRP